MPRGSKSGMPRLATLNLASSSHGSQRQLRFKLSCLLAEKLFDLVIGAVPRMSTSLLDTHAALIHLAARAMKDLLTRQGSSWS